MAQSAENMLRMSVPCSTVKPTSPVCKRLFDFPDPSVTKKMMQDMVSAESRRLKDVWNFDSLKATSAAKLASNAAEDIANVPTSPKKCRYVWELQDREAVPHFYSRPFHRHHSETRNLTDSPFKPSPTRIRKVLKEPNPESAPSPLGLRDENASCKVIRQRQKSSLSKQALDFKSPPRITSDNLNPSIARIVTALRIPLPSASQSTQSSTDKEQNTETAQPLNASDMAPKDPTMSTQSPFTGPKETSCMTLKTHAPRKLFPCQTGKKHTSSQDHLKQPKLTDMIQQRKIRQPSSKRRRISEEGEMATLTNQ